MPVPVPVPVCLCACACPSHTTRHRRRLRDAHSTATAAVHAMPCHSMRDAAARRTDTSCDVRAVSLAGASPSRAVVKRAVSSEP